MSPPFLESHPPRVLALAVALVVAGVVGAFGGDDHWAWQPLGEAPVPEVASSSPVGNPVDAFILARLVEAGLEPAPRADRRALVRRLSFDLRGLPPTEDEVRAFLADASPDAWVKLVDRMLADEAFGERLASMWLNVMRYAEDQAHQVGNDTKHFYPNAFRFREWVVEAFNRDLPYDEFIRLQLAADQMEAAESDLPALGFIGLGPKYYQRNNPVVMADEWEDRVDVVGRGLLGLTLACARCHDHKSDPITMHDYQALAGVFASTDLVDVPFGVDESALSKEEKDRNLHTIHVVRDKDVRDLPLFLRGDPSQKGDPVPRRFIEVLSQGDPEPFATGSGRLDLAGAIVDPSNPLTARVFVNRIWALVMGRGLVATRSDFGTLGERPSHPELLDWLARDFVESGWSVKHLVRRLATSATYCRSSVGDPAGEAVDEANRLWWRAERKRLSAEMLRDALLAASGTLEQGGGRSMEIGDPDNRRRTVYARVSRLRLDPFLLQFDYPDPNIHSARRAVTTTPAQKLFLMNSPFVLGQAETLVDRCRTVAAAGGPSLDDDCGAVVTRLYERLFARPPDDEERALAVEFVGGSAGGGTEGPGDRWTLYAQALLLSNEMLFVD